MAQIINGIDIDKEYRVIYKVMTQRENGTPRFWLTLHGVSGAVEVTACTYAMTSFSADIHYAPRIDLEMGSTGKFRTHGLW